MSERQEDDDPGTTVHHHRVLLIAAALDGLRAACTGEDGFLRPLCGPDLLVDREMGNLERGHVG